MAVNITRENYALHKLHSLTGVVPVGYYLAQHLVLNSFSLAGPGKFNSVIDFFEGFPKFLLPIIEATLIWIPLLFHAVYGLFITDRAKPNYFATKYKWSQNRMYTLQRWSGVFIALFLVYHVTTTTGLKYLNHDADVVKFQAWHDKLTSLSYGILVVYLLGVLASTYHLCFGLWNFSIRWGLAVSESAQRKVQKFSGFAFVALTLVGWLALVGFLMPHASESSPQAVRSGSTERVFPIVPQEISDKFRTL
jgi:succinate dehydrogenase / fumarate reductase cytochrome b subunit